MRGRPGYEATLLSQWSYEILINIHFHDTSWSFYCFTAGSPEGLRGWEARGGGQTDPDGCECKYH